VNTEAALLSTVAVAGGTAIGVGSPDGVRVLDPDVLDAADVDQLIRRWAGDWPGLRDRLGDLAGGERARRVAGEAKQLAPIRRPGKIVLVGANYVSHCEEVNLPIPEQPFMLAKFPSSISGPTDDIVWSSKVAQWVDYEAEVGVVIGASCRDVGVDEAHRSIIGYVAVNDVSARDIQQAESQWVRAKSLDTFCPLGPALFVPFDRDPTPEFHLSCSVNGEVRQSDVAGSMIFSVPRLIEELSALMTLEPGDLVTTGTPAGVAAFRTPPPWLRPGDEIVLEIEGIGRLANSVVSRPPG
jgi:2-keto-4-pentenoate hydratase/2-oxohepta-3-ene-1,7-dioic acid hydratase in catechol pathway